MWARILVTAIAALATGAGAPAPAPHHGGVSLAVAPARIEVTAGRLPARTFEVENTGSHAETCTVTVEAFRQGSSGNIGFYRGTAPQWGGNWLRITPDRLTIPAGKTRPVTVRVDVPHNAEPGDRYVGLVFTVPAPRTTPGQAGVTIDAGVGAQIIIRVPGDVMRRQRMTLSAPAFSPGGSVRLTLTVANTGTVYTLDNNVIASTGTRFSGLLILAGARRTESAEWPDPPVACLPCHVSVGHATASVWIIPIWEIAAGLLILAGTALIARQFARARRTSGRAPATTA